MYFQKVFFDIVGYCNAKCPYCLTGANKNVKSTVISVDSFSKILRILLNKKLIDCNSTISLYNWGEPFLHPDLAGIIQAIKLLGLKYEISTNASVIPKITKEMVKNLSHLIISMPGFSQESYDRISKLNFQAVKNNIIKLVKECRRFGFKGDISIFFHVYQFNADELKQGEMFAKKYGLIFSPRYAIINEWWLLQGWLKGTLRHEDMIRISEDIFCFEIRDKMRDAPKNYICPQYSYLVINEKADVVACCQLPADYPDFLCGNILCDDIEVILENKKNRPVCRECINTGLAYYINNSLVCPKFYQRRSNRFLKLF